MAVTVEELQILLSCDASQAKSVLDTMTGQVDRAVSAMSKKLNGGSFASEAERMTKSASDFMKNGMTNMPKIDTDKLISGTPYERLGEQLKLTQAKIESIKSELAGMGDADVSSPAVQKLYTDLIRASDKAEKLAEAMAKIEDSAGQGDGEKENIEETGKAAEEAAPKVEKYNKSLGKSSKQGGFFSKVSGAAHKAFNKFGNSFKHHEGFLSKFGKTLKRVMLRMMAMGLVRGVIRGFTQGLQMLAKASPAAAEQFGRFTAMTKAVKAALGSAALAVLNAFASVLYNIASAAVTAANAVARFFGALGGGKYFAVSMADGFDNLSDSMSGAGGAAKGMLADFDELNVIGQQGGGGGGGAMSIGNATVSEQDASSILADLIKNDEFEKAGEFINQKLGEISDKITQWFIDLDSKKYGKKFAELLNGIFSDPTAFEKAGKAVGTGINTIVNTIYDFLTTFDAGKAARSLASGLNALVKEINWAHIGEMLGEGVNTVFNFLYNFFSTFDFRAAAASLASSLNSLVQTIDWNKIGATILQAVVGIIEFIGTFLLNVDWGALVRGTIDIIVGFIEEFCRNPRRIFKAIVMLIGGIANLISGLVSGIISGILDLLATIFPGLEGWGDKVQEFFQVDTSYFESNVDDLCDAIFGAEEAVSGMANTVDSKTAEMGGMFDGLCTHVDGWASSAGDASSRVSTSMGNAATDTSTYCNSINNSIDGSITKWNDFANKVEEKGTHVSSSLGTHGGHSGKFMSEVGTAVDNASDKVDSAARKWDVYSGAVDSAAESVTAYTDDITDYIDAAVIENDVIIRSNPNLTRKKHIIEGVTASTIFLRGKVDELSDATETLSGRNIKQMDAANKMSEALRGAKDEINAMSDAINKIPTAKTTTYTFKASIEATASGSGGATVNRPNININMAMASGGIAYGETLARIGEYAGARVNPEVVAPLDKLQGILERSAVGGGKKETEKQNALLTEQNRLLRIIAEKELKISPSPELGQVFSRSAAMYGAV